MAMAVLLLSLVAGLIREIQLEFGAQMSPQNTGIGKDLSALGALGCHTLGFMRPMCPLVSEWRLAFPAGVGSLEAASLLVFVESLGRCRPWGGCEHFVAFWAE